MKTGRTTATSYITTNAMSKWRQMSKMQSIFYVSPIRVLDAILFSFNFIYWWNIEWLLNAVAVAGKQTESFRSEYIQWKWHWTIKSNQKRWTNEYIIIRLWVWCKELKWVSGKRMMSYVHVHVYYIYTYIVMILMVSCVDDVPCCSNVYTRICYCSICDTQYICVCVWCIVCVCVCSASPSVYENGFLWLWFVPSLLVKPGPIMIVI